MTFGNQRSQVQILSPLPAQTGPQEIILRGRFVCLVTNFVTNRRCDRRSACLSRSCAFHDGRGGVFGLMPASTDTVTAAVLVAEQLAVIRVSRSPRFPLLVRVAGWARSASTVSGSREMVRRQLSLFPSSSTGLPPTTARVRANMRGTIVEVQADWESEQQVTVCKRRSRPLPRKPLPIPVVRAALRSSGDQR